MVALGFAAGSTARGEIESVDHWIAFVLLSVIGGRMILAALSPVEAGGETRPAGRASPAVMALTALGTSIDSAVVGITLALVGVDPWLAVPLVGLASFSMSLTGVLLGRRLGAALGKWAEIAGGLVLIAIGTKILVDHLSQGG
jgi:putative Mn2+ efflux pump MntP